MRTVEWVRERQKEAYQLPNRGGGKRGGWSDRQTNPAANALKGGGRAEIRTGNNVRRPKVTDIELKKTEKKQVYIRAFRYRQMCSQILKMTA